MALALRPYVPPPGVVPQGTTLMAFDSSAPTAAAIAWAQQSLGTYWSEGLVFMGYAELANLTVRPEYRVISQVIATEMTRKWISFQSVDDSDGDEEQEVLSEAESGEEKEDEEEDSENPSLGADAPMDDAIVQLNEAKKEKQEEENEQSKQRAEGLAKKDGKAEKIKELEAEFDRLRIRDLFAKIAEFDGYFGRVHLYVDTGATDKPEELKTPIGDGSDEVTRNKIKKGSICRFAVVEPIWTYPQSYNSVDPLSPDWYNPSQWFVMGKQLHSSRLLTFVGRPVPDILKPAYAFGGLSLSQIAKPYVDNWLQTRQSVNDIIRAFSIMVLKTDMGSTSGAAAGPDGVNLFDRLDLFNELRDNRGVFAIDKENEDFTNVSAPLANLDALQAQSQEHMAAIVRIPLVKFLGISPAGLNASSEGELKTFYDTINSHQEFFFRPNLTTVMHLVMINLWGEVDEDITFKFNPLWALDEKEEAEVRKINAETDDILVNGVSAIHPEEVRRKEASDPDSPYHGIDVADVPDAPVDDSINLRGTEPFEKGAQGGEQDDEGGQPPQLQAAE